MPNFRGATFGLITRIGIRPSPHRPLYGVERDGVFIDALAVRYDQRRWLQEFLATWPPGSPAHISYFDRLIDGAGFSLRQAAACDESSGAMQHAYAP